MTRTIHSFILPLFGLAWVAGAACADTKSLAAVEGASRAEAAVAVIDGKPITHSELEAWAAPQLAEIDQRRHQILESSLGQMIDERLTELEAERRGVTVAELMAEAIDAKIEPVTDDDIDAFYNENKARMRQTKEAVAEQIRSYLTQQRSEPLRRDLVTDLRARYGVEINLEPIRVELAELESPAKGPEKAPVKLVEFSDFQCPACKRIAPTLDQLHEAYGDQLRIEFRQLPLTSIHPQAFKAAEASICAANQGKFWEMHDALFARQRELSIDQLKQRAQEIDLDRKAFDACLDNGEATATVQRDMAEAQRVGLSGTPTMFVNGRPVRLLRNPSAFEQLSVLIDDELARAVN
ncbi:MAG: thioredoxin domain-containing protein [Acidobacteriota bacterium]